MALQVCVKVRLSEANDVNDCVSVNVRERLHVAVPLVADVVPVVDEDRDREAWSEAVTVALALLLSDNDGFVEVADGLRDVLRVTVPLREHE